MATAKTPPPPRRVLHIRISPDEDARLERLDRQLSRSTRGAPSRSRVVRWALMELEARLDLAEQARGAGPTYTVAGPMIPPPD